MRLTIVSVCLMAVCWSDSGNAATRRAAAQIVSPKRNEAVAGTCEVTGKLQVPGQPIVLVRPDFGDKHYWVQSPPVMGERGYFKAAVKIGNDKAKSGSKFLVCVVVLRSAAEAEFFKGKESLPILPDELARSEEIPLILRRNAEAPGAELNVTFMRPQPNAKVHRLEECVGQGPPDLKPIVLVRSEEVNGEWWVQDEVVVGKGGYFKTVLHMGNDRTANGTRFRVVVVAPRGEKEAALLQVGAALKALPAGIPRSKEIQVELNNPQQPATVVPGGKK
jgi:hypothetical protein